MRVSYPASAAAVLIAANNLSDVASATTSRTNLGLGTGDSPQFTAVSLGSALQRSSPFEITSGAAASLTAGSGSIIVSSGASFNGLSILHTSFSTDADDGYKIRQIGTGTTSITLGGGSLLSATAGLTHQMDYANATYGWYWGTPGSEAAVNFYQGTLQTRIDVAGRVIPTGAPQGNNYYNALMKTTVVDSSGNSAAVGEWGSEGNWTNAGGFTERRHYLWDHDAAHPAGGRTIFQWSASNPDYFSLGEDTANYPLNLYVPKGRIDVIGDTITTNATGTILSGQFNGALAKTTAGGEAFYGVQIKPTLNTSASNASTMTVLSIDTTNTSTTGLTTHLFNASYGGTTRFNVDSSGQMTLTRESAGAPFLIDDFFTGAGQPYMRFRKGRGTAAAPLRSKANDGMGGLGFQGYYAADDVSTATLGSLTGALRFYVLEDFTSTAQGTGFGIDITPVGSTTSAQIFDLSAKGITIGAGISRSTTNPTNALTLPDGTEPSGTLTNAIQIVSVSGKLKLVDAAGTSGHVLSVSAVNTLSPTSPDRTLSVDINGTTYYIHAKTTND